MDGFRAARKLLTGFFGITAYAAVIGSLVLCNGCASIVS